MELAGMPLPFTLTEIARMRVEAISFFLLVLLISAALVRWLWNGLGGSFPRLPRLSYFKALSLVLLWGLLFTVVLAMISVRVRRTVTGPPSKVVPCASHWVSLTIQFMTIFVQGSVVGEHV
jgi:hypothetical protein